MWLKHVKPIMNHPQNHHKLGGHDINLIDNWSLMGFLECRCYKANTILNGCQFFGSSNREPRISLQDVLGLSKKHLPSFFKASLSSVW